MNKHTPGPWKVAVGMRGIGNALVSGVETTSGYPIANCGAWEEAPANARLIAMAPDLLDAVKAAHELLSNPDADGFDADKVEAQLHKLLKSLEG